MIQFNLLPDVKLEYVKAQRTKRMVLTVSVVAAAAALALFVLLVLTVDVWQKKTISDLSGDIKVHSSKLTSQPNLNKILTIQSQLGSLDTLHGQKPVTTRLADFMSQVTPSNATISDMKADFTANTLSVSGAAANLDLVNTFTDGLKFTKYTTADEPTGRAAFSNVVLSQFSRDSQHATYTITMSFDPVIFSSGSDVKLNVPNIITTRSVIEQPSVFQENK